MTDLQEAAEILARVEGELRAMIERALSDQRYRDVAAIAAIADRLAELVGAVEEGRIFEGQKASREPTGTHDADGTSAGGRGGESATVGAALGKKSSRGRARYPYFERDRDKLVKIGSSKKDRRTYEHRAPREAIMAFAGAVNQHAGGGTLFAMDDVLPVMDGDEVPTYQAYLALAWLRSVGVVDRKGKEGYVVRNDGCSLDEINRYWNALPQRK